jgi:predicted amidophosphoribosyltransferase
MRANAHLEMTFYCPICWSKISKDDRTCERCGADLTEADARPMIEKPCSALSHPEPETAVRAAWILGERRDKGMVRVIETTSDGFLAEAAAEALGKMDERALDCLRSASKHGPLRVRNAAHDAIKQILSGISRAEEKSTAP